MKLNKINKVEQENPNEDWDFDFSEYKEEEKITEDNLTSITDKKPPVTNYRSKYGASLENIGLLVNIRTTLSEKAIAVASRSGDMKDIKDLYGCLNEAWAIIKDIYGSLVLDEINNLDKVILKNIRMAEMKSHIPEILYEQLLRYRDKLYVCIQRAKLGFEVEKGGGSAFNKAKKGMVE